MSLLWFRVVNKDNKGGQTVEIRVGSGEIWETKDEPMMRRLMYWVLRIGRSKDNSRRLSSVVHLLFSAFFPVVLEKGQTDKDGRSEDIAVSRGRRSKKNATVRVKTVWENPRQSISREEVLDPLLGHPVVGRNK